MNLESKPVDLDELLQTAALAGATDVLLSPAPHLGKLIVRAASVTIMSRVVEPGLLRSLSTQLGLRTGQPALLGAGSPGLDASLASFELKVRDVDMRVRVICTPTPNGPVVRLRLQSRDLLRQALEQFRAGRFGALEVLRVLEERDGVIFVAGPTSSGKTSALHHLVACMPTQRAVAVMSEAEELPLPHLGAVQSNEAEVVAIDEIDETEKIATAMRLGRRQLVLATLTCPTLELALRRIRGTCDDLEPLVGVLRVDWRGDEAIRVAAYRWFGLEGRAPEARIPRALVDRMHDLEAFQALGRLEAQ
ncbi:MAG: hypothetical protein EB084_09705 [Proteobacteria bacterium]|nr:hypothetical protein [Pseudomonadota bacterium]